MGFDGTDVTKGSERLAEAIGDDSKVVIYATGFKLGWDLFAPWKVSKFCACVVDIYVIWPFVACFIFVFVRCSYSCPIYSLFFAVVFVNCHSQCLKKIMRFIL